LSTYFDEIVLVQNDYGKDLEMRVVDKDGNAHDLTGATLKFYMRKRGATTNKVDGASATIVDAAQGTCKYTWQSGDLDTVGVYDCQLEIIVEGSSVITASGLVITVIGEFG